MPSMKNGMPEQAVKGFGSNFGTLKTRTGYIEQKPAEGETFEQVTTDKGIKLVNDVKQIPLIAFDSLPLCRNENCSAYALCDYRNRTNKKYCTVMKNYLHEFYSMFFRIYSDGLTEDKIWQVGIHLIPLYKMLCKFSIYEVSVNSPIYRTKYDGYAANPVYSQIRDTIKRIEQTWAFMKLDGRAVVPGVSMDSPGDYVEGLESGKVVRRKIKRKV